MNDKLVKEIFDACFIAKKVTEMMPELPRDMKPRHIHVIDAIYTCKKNKELVCVSDISNALNITTPSVTKLIKELEKKDVVEKIECKEDKRITYLELTAYGKELYKVFVEEYHSKVAKVLNNISDEEAKTFIKVANEVYNLMKNNIMEDN